MNPLLIGCSGLPFSRMPSGVGHASTPQLRRHIRHSVGVAVVSMVSTFSKFNQFSMNTTLPCWKQKCWALAVFFSYCGRFSSCMQMTGNEVTRSIFPQFGSRCVTGGCPVTTAIIKAAGTVSTTTTNVRHF